MPPISRRPFEASRAFLIRSAGAALAFGTPVLLLGHGALSLRLEETAKASQAQPANPELHFKLADLYIEHEEWEKGLVELDRVESLSPGLFPVDYLRGCALLAAGRTEEALLPLNRFLAQHPDNSLGLLQRARVHRTLKSIELSLRDFREALRTAVRLEPDLVLEAANAVAESGNHEEALRIVENGMAQMGPVPSLSLRALDLETVAGRFDAALARIDTLQKTAPRSEPWQAKRATLLAQAGRTEEARAAWQALIAHLAALPNLERGSHAMSRLAEQAHEALKELEKEKARDPRRANYEEELDRANREIARNPRSAVLYFRRAEFNRLAGQADAARADCDQVDHLAPLQFATNRVRAQVLASEGKSSEALRLLQAHLEAHPADGQAIAARARLEMALGLTDDGLRDFERCLALDSFSTPELVNEAAAAFHSVGKDDECIRILNTGVAKHPAAALVARLLDLHLVRGEVGPAVVLLDTLAADSPRPELWLGRKARFLHSMKHEDDARRVWQAILEKISVRPNLERGAPDLAALAAEARTALSVSLPLDRSRQLTHRLP